MEEETKNKIIGKVGLQPDGLYCPDGSVIPRSKTTHVKEYPHTDEQKLLKAQWLPELIKNHPKTCPTLLEWLVDEAVTTEGLKKINDYHQKKINS